MTKVVSITNHSPIDVKYQWSFIDGTVAFENKDEDEGMYSIYSVLLLSFLCVCFRPGIIVTVIIKAV